MLPPGIGAVLRSSRSCHFGDSQSNIGLISNGPLSPSVRARVYVCVRACVRVCVCVCVCAIFLSFGSSGCLSVGHSIIVCKAGKERERKRHTHIHTHAVIIGVNANIYRQMSHSTIQLSKHCDTCQNKMTFDFSTAA